MIGNPTNKNQGCLRLLFTSTVNRRPSTSTTRSLLFFLASSPSLRPGRRAPEFKREDVYKSKPLNPSLLPSFTTLQFKSLGSMGVSFPFPAAKQAGSGWRAVRMIGSLFERLGVGV